MNKPTPKQQVLALFPSAYVRRGGWDNSWVVVDDPSEEAEGRHTLIAKGPTPKVAWLNAAKKFQPSR